MSVPFSNTKLRVPRGFQNLLEGLAKEVLRNQPENIHDFAAIYFHNLVKIREDHGTDPAEIGAKHEDRFYNNKAFTKAGNMGDVSDTQQQEAATTIQAAVRGHQAREDLKSTEAERVRQEEVTARIQETGEGDGSAPGSRTDVKESEVDIDLDDPETAKAATMIQAQFRGYQTRKILKDKDETPPSTEPPGDAVTDGATGKSPPNGAEETVQPPEQPTGTGEEEVDIDLSDPEVEKAAVKIQGGFKMLKAKREVEELRRAKEESVTDIAKDEEETEEMVKDVTAPSIDQEVDIDLNDPEVGKAAEKIQATFRGFQTRRKLKEEIEPSEEAPETKAEVTESPEGSETEVLLGHIDPSDPQVNIAASKIQAGYKGMKVRKELKSKSSDATDGRQTSAEDPKSPPAEVAKDETDRNETEQTDKDAVEAAKEESAIDIDLNDPEVEQAAMKIQAGFKGFKARKEKKNTESGSADKLATEGGEEKTPSAGQPEALPTSEENPPPVIENAPPASEDMPPDNEDTPPANEDMPSEDEEDTPLDNKDAPPNEGETIPTDRDNPPEGSQQEPNSAAATE